MKVIVAVASKHGSTSEIAAAIAEELRARRVDAELVPAGNEPPRLTGYDAAVVGSGIYMGQWLPEARSFVERNREALGRMPVWLFSSGPLGTDDPQPHDDPAKYTAPLGNLPVSDHRIFVGKLDPEGLGFTERLMVKVVKAPPGDFRDWGEIRGWAREIAAALAPSPSAAQ